MKKSLFCLSLLIIALAFIVSCSEPDALTDDVVFASFSNDVMAADLSVSYSGLKSYDELYWYYAARKCDVLGTTGETNILKKVPGDSVNGKGLDGKVGPFSQGKWKFQLFAFEELIPETDYSSATDYVYKGATPDSGDKVIHLSKNGKNYIPVSVTPNGQGTVSINTEFKWAEGGLYTANLYLSIKVDGNEVLNDEGSVLSPYNNNSYPIDREFALGEGMHTFVFTVKDSADGDELAIDVLRTKVFAGMTTTITGDQVELTAGEVYFSVPVQDVISKTVTSGQKTEFTSNLAPAKATGNATTITFEEDALAASTNYKLKMTVTPIEAASAKAEAGSFSIESNDAIVAGVDFELSKITIVGTETTEVMIVENFNNSKYAVIETYIAKGLSAVKVWYNGNGKDAPIASSAGNTNVATMFDTDTAMGDSLGYSKESGLLRFKTNHFSEYYVTSAAEVLNVTSNKAYTSLREALTDAVPGAEIKVLKDIALENSIIIDKDVTLDLNGMNITVSSSWKAVSPTRQAIFYVKSGACFTVNDSSNPSTGKIDSTGADSNLLGAIIMTITGNNDTTQTAKLVINGGLIQGPNYGISTNGTRPNTEITINGGKIVGTGVSMYHPDTGKLTINGGTFEGYNGLDVKGGSPVTINGGTFIATGAFITPEAPDGSGSKRVGSALYVEGNYAYGAQVVINGGTFSTTDPSAPAVRSLFNDSGNPATIRITGGTFSSDPSAYVHPAYKAIKTQESPETWTVRERRETDEDAVAKIGSDYYASLKAAVDDAVDGDTVELFSGMHNEAVVIEKDITLQGLGEAIIRASNIEKQEKLSGEASDYYGIVCVKNSTVKFKNIIISGNEDEAYSNASTLWSGGRYAGIIAINSSIELEGCSIEDITYANGIEGLKGGQNGFGIYAANETQTPVTITLKNTEISNFNKAGIVARANINIDIDGCTFTGFGEQGQIAQNGVQFAGNATFKNSKFEGMIYTGENPNHGCVAIYNVGSGNATVSDVNVHDVDFISSVGYSSGITTIKSGSYSSYNNSIETGTDKTNLIAIEGGTFSFDPSAYVDSNNYSVTENGTTWIVTAKVSI